MAKYLDENGLKTLISDIKRDIESTAWRDENGDISKDFSDQLQEIVESSIGNNESVKSINDINNNLKSSLKYIFNLGTKTTKPTEFSTGQYVNSGLIFENTGYATWDFNGDPAKASRVGTLILVKSDIDFWVPEDATKIYKFNREDILAFSVTTSNSQVICDTLTNDKITGKFSAYYATGEWNPDAAVFVSSDVVDPTASSSVTSIKLVKAATLPAGLYMVTGIGQVLNILSGVQYTIGVNSVAEREIIKPFIPREYNTDSIINSIEGEYAYFSFQSSNVQTEQGDLMIGFDGNGNSNSLTLLNFNDPYENTKEYDCIEFGVDERNNILKTNIKGSNIFGELKLIPINTEHSPKDVAPNDAYISSRGATEYTTEIGQDYCLVFTGRGTLSSLTVSDVCHTVKITTNDSTEVKMSSIYPVYLFRNKVGGFDLLTLPGDNSNLKIS